MNRAIFALTAISLIGVLAQPARAAVPNDRAEAVFAGGCFWCTEADFEKLPGVLAAESGYSGGKNANPSYKEVSNGSTGHTEVVRVTYKPSVVSYAQLVEYFWRTIDPTVVNRQFCDQGSQYRSAIFWRTPQEKQIAEDSRNTLLQSGRFKQINTEISAAKPFYLAEAEHQDYYKVNPLRYSYYRSGCGRDERLRSLWGDEAGKMPTVSTAR
jgi:peptide-methionine (S)-S-oxide reductase